MYHKLLFKKFDSAILRAARFGDTELLFRLLGDHRFRNSMLESIYSMSLYHGHAKNIDVAISRIRQDNANYILNATEE